MSSAADNACVKHMNVTYSFGQESYQDIRGNALSKYFYGNDPTNNPTYICKTFWKQLYDHNDPRTTRICRFYIDDYMSLTSADGREDVTDAVIATQAANPTTDIISTVAPGEFSWDAWPSYTDLPGSALALRIAEIQALHPGYAPATNPRWLKPKLANNFLRSDNPGVVMTYAEVCFLRAEAAVLGWTSDDAKTMYEAGIREAMNFLYDYYECERITDSELAAYLAEPSIAFAAGNDDRKRQINTQAWILHFHNPAEAWANRRRSDYPALVGPDPANEKTKPIDGVQDIPVRLCYPKKEETYSADEYNAAKDRVTGTYNWHARLWWDVK